MCFTKVLLTASNRSFILLERGHDSKMLCEIFARICKGSNTLLISISLTLTLLSLIIDLTNQMVG